MAHQYRIDGEQRLALVTVSGSISGTQLARLTRTLYEEPAWEAGYDAIWDFTGITELLLEKNDITDLIDVDQEYAHISAGGRDVFIVSRDLDYAMGRIHSAFARKGPRESHVCRSMDEAFALLGRTRRS